jgi:hypothetical protein
VDEVLKFLPDGADGLPDSAFWTERGETVRMLDPSRFEPCRLVALRDKYRGESARLPEVPPELPHRLALMPDPERVRVALRDQLTAAASAVYPETELMVEDDAGPLEVEPGRYWSEITVTTGSGAPPWEPVPALVRVGGVLAADGWQVEGILQDGDRYESVSRRAGAEVVASMRDQDGILRLAGHTAPLPVPGAAATPGDAGPRWSAGNEVAEALLVAHDRGDGENVTGLLRVAALYLPVPEDLDGMGEDEEVPIATGAWAETSYHDLVALWPDPAWRLAVNPGTPVETHLAVEPGGV